MLISKGLLASKVLLEFMRFYAHQEGLQRGDAKLCSATGNDQS
ncbi:hypothetical protein [Pseudomonas viridiflava]|nr:hypothetical protein [Pseudomonas viridiflava]MDY0918437.1 hypothetical protein [Pseudomonas viridiflava]